MAIGDELMSVSGYLASLLNALDAETKKVLVPAFDYVTNNWRLGDNDRAQNAQWYRVSGSTPATALQEFSILHGLDTPPTKFIPVMELNSIGTQIVPLVVSRAPDAKRIYFVSLSTSAAFSGYVE